MASNLDSLRLTRWPVGNLSFLFLTFFSLSISISFVMILLNWSFSSAEQLLHCLLLSQLFQLLSIPVSRSKKTTDNKINGRERGREEKSFRLSFLFCTFRFPERGHKVVNHLGCAAAAAAPTSGQEFAVVVVITTTVN